MLIVLAGGLPEKMAHSEEDQEVQETLHQHPHLADTALGQPPRVGFPAQTTRMLESEVQKKAIGGKDWGQLSTRPGSLTHCL